MGTVKIIKTEYLGWTNCVKISNGIVELIVTTDVGPRIIHYGFKGGPNHMKVFPEQAGKSGLLTVNLPADFHATKAVPVNLRGEPAGDAVKILDGAFSFKLGAFAPASFRLE